MGVWLTRNFIEVANKSFDNGLISNISYRDINNELINSISKDDKIRTIQISEELSGKAYTAIDKILEKNSSLVFRIYGLYNLQHFDISFLKKMQHLRHLRIDCHLRNSPELIDFDIIKNLNLKSLSLEAFDLHDYSFIQHLSRDIEELTIYADTMGKVVKFDCEWLLQYKKLHTLWLGKKAKKNIQSLSKMHSLKSLSLRGIKLTNFEFLKNLNLEKLELLWHSNNELKELKELKSLKQIGLWRINTANCRTILEINEGYANEHKSSETGIDLLIFRPTKNQKPKEKTPGILWIHGGGYISGMASRFTARRLPISRTYEKPGSRQMSIFIPTAFIHSICLHRSGRSAKRQLQNL